MEETSPNFEGTINSSLINCAQFGCTELLLLIVVLDSTKKQHKAQQGLRNGVTSAGSEHFW